MKWRNLALFAMALLALTAFLTSDGLAKKGGSKIAFTMGSAAVTNGIRVLDLETGAVTIVRPGWTDGFKDLDWSRTANMLAFIDSDEGPDRNPDRGGSRS